MRRRIALVLMIFLLMTLPGQAAASDAPPAGDGPAGCLLPDAESSLAGPVVWQDGTLAAEGSCLWRITGSGSSLLAADFSADYPSVCVLDGCLCYAGTDGIMRISGDKADPEKISSQTGWVFTDGDALYCATESSIYRIADGQGEELVLRVYPLVNEGAFAVMNTMSRFAAGNGQIYYVLTMAQDYELWKVDTDGSGNSRLASICPPDREIMMLLYAPSEDRVYVRFTAPEGLIWKAIDGKAACAAG